MTSNNSSSGIKEQQSYGKVKGKGGYGYGKSKDLFSNSFSNSKSSKRTTNDSEKSVSLPWQLQVGYQSLVDRLIFQQRPSKSDLAHICFFHLRANRITEARSLFSELNERMDDNADETDNGELKLQLDYLSAYLDLYGTPNYNGHDFSVARSIAEKYKNYPILHWRARFNEILSLLARSAPLSSETIIQQVLAHGRAEDGGVVQQGGGLHISSAKLDLEVKGNTLAIAWHPGKACVDQVKRVSVYYYAMDIEVIFSRDPFADQNRISPHLLGIICFIK